MALTVFVLRSSLGDCTLNGVTSQCTTFTLLGENEEPAGKGPFLRLAKRHGHIYCEPIESKPGAIGPMNGGNFVYTSDSRWRDLVGHGYPISVHDRFETVAQYNSNLD